MTTVTDAARGFTIVRRYPAPRELVFRAWTDPDQLGWFAGPGAPELPTTVDLRVGGQWRTHMRESDAADDRGYVTGGVYREIVPNARLVFAFGAVGGWPEIDLDDLDTVPQVDITFTEVDGTTEMVCHFGFADSVTAAEVARWFSLGVREGWTMTVDRLVPATA